MPQVTVSLWWNGPEGGDIDDPSAAQVDRVLDSLDGVHVDQAGILFEGDGQPIGTVVVGGGLKNRLLPHWQWYGPDHWNNDLVMLVDRSQGDGLFANSQGGQRTDLPGRWSVERSVVRQALHRFFAARVLDDGLDWEFQPAIPGVARELSPAEVQAISAEIVRRTASI